jgi:hypothetical protein
MLQGEPSSSVNVVQCKLLTGEIRLRTTVAIDGLIGVPGGGKRWLEKLGRNDGTFPNAQPNFSGL